MIWIFNEHSFRLQATFSYMYETTRYGQLPYRQKKGSRDLLPKTLFYIDVTIYFTSVTPVTSPFSDASKDALNSSLAK